MPASYLADPALLEDFYRAHPDAPGRSLGVSRRKGGTVTRPGRTHARSPAHDSPTLPSGSQSVINAPDADHLEGYIDQESPR